MFVKGLYDVNGTVKDHIRNLQIDCSELRRIISISKIPQDASHNPRGNRAVGAVVVISVIALAYGAVDRTLYSLVLELNCS